MFYLSLIDILYRTESEIFYILYISSVQMSVSGFVKTTTYHPVCRYNAIIKFYIIVFWEKIHIKCGTIIPFKLLKVSVRDAGFPSIITAFFHK